MERHFDGLDKIVSGKIKEGRTGAKGSVRPEGGAILFGPCVRARRALGPRLSRGVGLGLPSNPCWCQFTDPFVREGVWVS